MSKPVSFYSEGVKLAGDLFLPADVKRGDRRAGIVLCHGYTGVRSIYLPDNARVLAEAGYVVMSFDYKGWGRAGEPKKLVILKGFGHYEVYGGEAFRQVMDETVAWYKMHLPAR